jgi:cytochrome P450
MIIPTTYPSLRDPEVYPNPDVFDPERWVTGDAEVKGAKNWLVFGTGPHYCLGQVYAQLNLALMIGKASLHLDWVHHPTPLSEEIKVFATIFPMVSLFKAHFPPIADGIRMTVLWSSPRDHRSPNISIIKMNCVSRME